MNSATDESVLCRIENGVMELTLNRPQVMNAYTAQMGVALADAFRRADQDDAVRVVLVTGAGRAFCAGADISAGAGAFDTTRTDGPSASFGDVSKGFKSGGLGLVGAIMNCRKPSIAAINGAAVGIGATMTLPMDIRIASRSAKFGFVFARRGMVPELGSSWFLPRVVGRSQALRWCLTGEVFGADEALKGGLLSEVTEPEQLLESARALARTIADNTSAISIALTRQMLWRLPDEPTVDKAMDIDRELSLALGSSADVREGVTSFLEKRPPKFPGKPSTDMPALYPWWSDANEPQ